MQKLITLGVIVLPIIAISFAVTACSQGTLAEIAPSATETAFTTFAAPPQEMAPASVAGKKISILLTQAESIDLKEISFNSRSFSFGKTNHVDTKLHGEPYEYKYKKTGTNLATLEYVYCGEEGEEYQLTFTSQKGGIVKLRHEYRDYDGLDFTAWGAFTISQ